VKRGEVYWTTFPPPLQRRPALVVTRTAALPVRTRVTVAPVTTRIRGIHSEVPLGRAEGLPKESIAGCDNLQTISQSALDPEPIGWLDISRIPELDAAVRYALEIRY
jgi:mRNA interferase MazF